MNAWFQKDVIVESHSSRYELSLNTYD